MSKKGVSVISGNISPIAGEKYTYHIVDWYKDTPISERNPKNVIWELFRKRKNGKFTTTNIKKKGDSNFTFGEASIGNTYRLEGYLHQPEGGGLVITPKQSSTPKINKVELFYVDDTKGSTFSFRGKLRARAYCSNMFNKELVFTLWEDDAKGSGHNANNKVIDTAKAKVNEKGVAVVEFMLTKALMQKAIQGETDVNQLEFYVTVEYYKNKKHASNNESVNNPFPQPQKTQPNQPVTKPKEIPKAKGSAAEQKPKSKKEEKGIGEKIAEAGKELWDWWEGKGTIKKEQQPTIEKHDEKSMHQVNPKQAQTSINNCGEKYCIKKGDKSELIREINIRLAGFGGNVPTDEFTDITEKMIKQFQKDYMKVPETGKICGNVLKAIDDFQSKYIINFEDVKCPCGKCKGFGNDKFSDQKQNSKIDEKIRKYEYPGIHRSLIWALRAAMFYTTVIEKDLKYSVKCIFSGYRCHENNKQHKRTSTNHMGKALDIHFNKNGKRTQVPKEVEEIRQKIFVKHLGNQVRWDNDDKFSLEPGVPAYKGEFIASTWIHYDVRQFGLEYLKDDFFVKNINQINGESIVSLATKTKPDTCNCMGGGTVAKVNTPAILPKTNNTGFTEDDGKQALKAIYNKYGKDMAIIIERMYRDETAHFKSGQYKACGTGGMEAFGSAPYYGWDSSFFEANPEFHPIGIWSAYENKGMSGQGGNQQVTTRKKEFVVLPSVLAGMEYKAFYINKHNGNWARWHSTKASNQQTYKTHIESIKPRFVNEFENEK